MHAIRHDRASAFGETDNDDGAINWPHFCAFNAAEPLPAQL